MIWLFILFNVIGWANLALQVWIGLAFGFGALACVLTTLAVVFVVINTVNSCRLFMARG